jgi:hypothetical protein
VIKDNAEPFDFREALRRERQSNRAAADVFAEACKQGDVELLLYGTDLLNATVDGWRVALAKVARLSSVSADISAAFLTVWIESKHLALIVGNRRVVANALRVLLPPCADARPTLLFRGAGANERRRRLYGFSWTTRLEIARNCAEQRRPIGAVILETTAPSEAILLMREDQGYYDEGEVLVDRFRLGNIRCIERLTN